MCTRRRWPSDNRRRRLGARQRVRQRRVDPLADGERQRQFAARLLWHVAERAAVAAARRQHHAGARWQQAEQRLQQRRLAGAVAAEHEPALAGVHGQRNVDQHGPVDAARERDATEQRRGGHFVFDCSAAATMRTLYPTNAT
jgi:hypothetical protein